MVDRSAEKKPANNDISLPLYRIRTIMKSSPGVSTINQESVHLIAKATVSYLLKLPKLYSVPIQSCIDCKLAEMELFITQLALMAFRASDNETHMDYSHLAEVVNSKTKLEFLQDIIPRKITGREYLEMMKNEDTEDSDL